MVLFLVADAVSEAWIRKHNRSARSLASLYGPDKDRRATYEEISQEIVREVETGRSVCAAFYGHPGAFALPSRVAVKLVRERGYEARMLPAVSSADCLYADLLVDPADAGCQSFEATDFLLRHKRWDPSSHLLLWQVGLVGQVDGGRKSTSQVGLEILVKRLANEYPQDHEICLYEAANLPVADAQIQHLRLRDLPGRDISVFATLSVPPAAEREVDLALAEVLGIGRKYWR